MVAVLAEFDGRRVVAIPAGEIAEKPPGVRADLDARQARIARQKSHEELGELGRRNGERPEGGPVLVPVLARRQALDVGVRRVVRRNAGYGYIAFGTPGAREHPLRWSNGGAKPAARSVAIVPRVEALIVRPGIFVPADALSMHAARSGGPGGQNVNKVSSKVELRADIDRIVGLDPASFERLRALAAGRLDAEGRLLVVSQHSRDQRANLEDAREKIRALVLRALEVPRRRKRTRPTRGSNERRIAEKKLHGMRKASRRDGGD